ncbi:MAG: cell division protein SepF [Archangium gephyra]|uniref:Cell division protein SepF n=1 Tax=Archangium gephyra TaxID=48 RepID=A0A2W5SUL3_9BACT|nr:MAG: cell division protein SepF [Archangium gephyra]
MANPIRNAMVYLGLADEEAEELHEPQARSAAPAPAPQPAHRGSVTPIRRTAARPAAEMNEILTVHPRAFKDVQVIAEHFREGVPVIINISQMTDGEARRLIDFACGLAEALYGRIERVTGKVFLLSPAHVAVSGDQGELESDVEASFFADV